MEVTDAPVIVSMQQMLRGKEGILSLAQGIVHWSPPEEALQAARAAVDEPNTSLYCADDGLAELRAALKLKLAEQNGIVASEVMVTAGANQAYTNVVLALLDAGEEVGVFCVDIDGDRIAEARGRVPSLQHDRSFSPPVPLTPKQAAE